jgi:hypothetical protein
MPIGINLLDSPLVKFAYRKSKVDVLTLFSRLSLRAATPSFRFRQLDSRLSESYFDSKGWYDISGELIAAQS